MGRNVGEVIRTLEQVRSQIKIKIINLYSNEFYYHTRNLSIHRGGQEAVQELLNEVMEDLLPELEEFLRIEIKEESKFLRYNHSHFHLEGRILATKFVVPRIEYLVNKMM